MAQFSNHLKILLTKPTTKIQEAKLVKRPRHVRRSVQKREVGVVQASQPHFMTKKDERMKTKNEKKNKIKRKVKKRKTFSITIPATK